MMRFLSTWWNQPAGGREVLRVTLPLMVSTASWTVMTFIDRLFLFWYSADALAASLPGAMVNFLVLCPFLGLAAYVNAFVAQYFGAGKYERVGPAVWQGMWLGVLVIPVALLTNPFAPALFALIGHEPAVQAAEVEYFQILNFGSGAMVLAGAMSSFFTGRGRVRTVMVVDVTSAAINVVLDYLWIFGYGGFPEWGIAGAAWATVVALWFKPLAYGVLMALPEAREVYATLSGWRLDRELMGRLLRYGSPNSVQMLLEVGSFSLFLMIVGRLGALELTACNLAFTINNLAFMPVYGIGIATTTLVGQRLGENEPDLAARSTWSALSIGGAYNAFMAVIYLACPEVLLRLAGMNLSGVEHAELERLVVVLLRFVAAYCLFDTMYIIFSSALKGAGDTKFVLLVTLALAGLPGLGTALGVNVLGFGIFWGWSVLTLWVLLLGVIYLARFLQGAWRSKRVIEGASPEKDLPSVERFAVEAAIE